MATRETDELLEKDGPSRTQTDLVSGSPVTPSAVRTSRPENALDALPIRSRDRYELLGEHAHGGLGRILRARDRDLGRPLAIKEIKSPDGATVERFVREALITASLEHPAIVPVHEAGRWETGEPFFAMKMVSGRTLKEAVRERKTVAERLSLLPNIIAACDAMAYAHARGIIHRDLKASNVLVGEYGETLVIDWGLAKDLGATHDAPVQRGAVHRVHAEATIAGDVIGTPAFMPPEQARGEDVDARADVYALGALLYYTLTGRPPHQGKDAAEVLARARTVAPRPIEEAAPKVSRDLATIVRKAMATRPDDRYPTAAELVHDLKRFQTGQMVSSHSYSAAEIILRWIRKNRALALATVAFAVLATAGGALFVLREQRLRREAETERARADHETLALLEKRGRDELLEGHPIQAAVYLSDALRRDPGSATLRSLVTQALVPMRAFQRDLVGHEHDITSVAYSPDGDRIVTASTDKTARIWRPRTGELLLTLRGHEKLLDWASWSPDGKLVATAGGDKTVRVWRADTGEQIHSFADPNPYRVYYTPDGTTLVVGDQSGEIRFLDAKTGARLATRKVHDNRIQSVAFRPDGKRMLVGAWDRKVTEWDLATREVVLTVKDHDRDVTSVTYSNDGKQFLSVEEDHYLHVRHADTGARAYTILLPESARFAASTFSPDDSEIVTRAHDGAIRVYHASSGALLLSIDAQAFGKLFSSAVSPDGDEVVTAGLAGSMHVYRLDLARGYRLLDHRDAGRADVHPSIYTPDGAHVITGGSGGRLTSWNAETLAREEQVEVPGNAWSIAANIDGSRVLVAGTAKESLPPRIFATGDGREVAALDHPKFVHNVAGSADGTRFVSASNDGLMRIFDAESGALLGSVQVEKAGRVSAVAFSPDGAELAAAHEDGRLHRYDARTLDELGSIKASSTWIQDVVYSRDGERILTCGRQDHTGRIWSRATGALLATLHGHNDNMMYGSFSPDGRLVATSGMDQVANIWDASTGFLLRSIRGPSYTAAFSPDGAELLTTGASGYAVLWDMRVDTRSPEEIVAYVAERAPWVLVDGRLELKR